MRLVKRLFGFKVNFTVKELADLISLIQDQPDDLPRKIKELKATKKGSEK